MHAHPTRFRLHPLSLAVALLSASQAFADSPAASPAETVLDTVQVTANALAVVPSEQTGSYTVKKSNSATRMTMTLKETPQAVSVVTRAKIDDFKLNSVNDLLDTVTGVNVERVETDRTYYTARGFDITNFQLDGVGMPFVYGNQYGDIDISPYDRVEVIRGANGLLSGTGNPSATVNFVRKRPSTDFQAAGALSLGSWGKQRAEADLSGALNEAGTVRGRLVAAQEQGDSYLDRLSYDKSSVYGIVEADIGDHSTAALGVMRQQKITKGGMWGGLPLYDSNGKATDYDVSTSTATDWTEWNNTDTQAFAELSHRFGNGWQAKASYTHREQKSRDKLFYVYGTPDASTGLGLYSYPSRFDDKNVQDLLDLSAEGEYSLLGRRHQLSLGAQLGRAKLDSLSLYGQGIGTALPDLASWDGRYTEPSFDAASDGANFKDSRKSVYAASRLHLSEQLKVLLGGAVTRLETTGSSYGVSSYRDQQRLTPYAGLTYSPDNAATLYASYAEIFDPQSKVDSSLQRLAPVIGKSYELGWKHEWLARQLNTSISAFHIEQNNLGEAAGYVGATAVYKGVDTRSRGIELEASGNIGSRVQTTLAYTALSIEDRQGRKARTYVPRHLVQASATWRVPGQDKLKLGGSVIWKSKAYTVDNGVTITQRDYAVVNLMARYDFSKQLSASLNLNNVGNQKYINSLYWTQGYYGAPRNATVTLAWQY